jgi:hypothetical protein
MLLWATLQPASTSLGAFWSSYAHLLPPAKQQTSLLMFPPGMLHELQVLAHDKAASKAVNEAVSEAVV